MPYRMFILLQLQQLGNNEEDSYTDDLVWTPGAWMSHLVLKFCSSFILLLVPAEFCFKDKMYQLTKLLHPQRLHLRCDCVPCRKDLVYAQTGEWCTGIFYPHGRVIRYIFSREDCNVQHWRDSWADLRIICIGLRTWDHYPPGMRVSEEAQEIFADGERRDLFDCFSKDGQTPCSTNL
jgi:hypothetical protein